MRRPGFRGTTRLVCGALLALCAACTPHDAAPTDASPPVSDTVADRLAALYENDRFWPARVWLEAPLVSEAGDVLVKPHRPGVLVYLRPNGDARIDFGRHGAHTVPVQQTNFVAEAARVRSGEASKTFPNLLGMLMNRVVDASGEALEVKHLAAEDIRGGRILLVFADAAKADVPGLVDFAARVEAGGDVRLVAFVPITEELDGDVLTDLRAGGWSHPFVMTPMARSYVPAMLEPGAPRPFARLCTDEGRILAEGPPDDETAAAIVGELGPGAG